MVFGNIKDDSFAEKDVQMCLEYAASHDLKALDSGTYQIDGDRVFVNVVEYTTTTPENRFWEAHKKYLDVHLMLDGIEQIDVNFIWNMAVKEFVEEDDFLPMQGDKKFSVVLEPGDFLVCYPCDGHRTAVAAKEKVKIKKAIFKIAIEN